MNARPRILFFIESLHCGGAEKSLISLLQSLDYDAVDVDLLTLIDTGIFRRYIPERVNIIKMPPSRGLIARLGKAAYSLVWRFYKMAGIRRHASELRWTFASKTYPPLDRHYDVAIAYQQGLPTYYISECVKANKKIAWINIDLEHAGYNKKFVNRYYDRYDNLVAVSAQLHDTLRTTDFVDRSKLVTVYDILNEDLIRKMALEPMATFSGNSTLRIVTVGRLAKQKNYPLAVQTAKILSDKGVDFEWIFVGDGPERSAVESMIDHYQLSDRVILAGEQSNPYPYMHAADIYVHTASFEGFGLTIAEAKILGKPVVSTDFRIVYDQITDGENGLICKMTPESVAENILHLISDKALTEKIKRNLSLEHNTTAETEVEKFYRLTGVTK